MKINYKVLLLTAICLLGLVQIYYSVSQTKNPPAREEPAQIERPKAPPPSPADVTKILLAGPEGETRVALARRGTGWVIESLFDAPAEQARIERFLAALLDTDTLSAPGDDTISGATAGTGPAQGILVSLGLGGEAARPFAIIGLRPEGSFDSAYARMLDTGAVHILSGDLRGDMGVWRNQPDALPESRPWLETRVLAFDPLAAESLNATYPDHRLAFAKSESGEWTMEMKAPGGEWNADGLAAWLADLADFRITDVGAPENRSLYGLAAPTHTITVGFPEGISKTINATPDRSGDGMWVETSDYPGQMFNLPGWRFQTCFQRISSLFPKASPTISAEAIRFIDIRRSGESVKLSRREDGWHAVAVQYPLRGDRIEKLARVLAEWRPLDYAEPGDRTARPDFGGPLLEITLAEGDVHQYRLGGRHPVFPWRYIQVDGTTLLAIEDNEADVLFPEFSEFLDLGKVFDGFEFAQITSLELFLLDGGDALVSSGLTANGEWEVTSPFGSSLLRANEVEGLVAAPLTWRVAGFGRKYHPSADSSNLIKLIIKGGGAEKSVVFLPWEGRDIPYLDDDGRIFLVDRSEFLAWLGVMRAINQRLDEETVAKARAREEEARKALEAAEAEAVAQALEAEEKARAAGETVEPEPEDEPAETRQDEVPEEAEPEVADVDEEAEPEVEPEVEVEPVIEQPQDVAAEEEPASPAEEDVAESDIPAEPALVEEPGPVADAEPTEEESIGTPDSAPHPEPLEVRPEEVVDEGEPVARDEPDSGRMDDGADAESVPSIDTRHDSADSTVSEAEPEDEEAIPDSQAEETAVSVDDNANAGVLPEMAEEPVDEERVAEQMSADAEIDEEDEAPSPADAEVETEPSIEEKLPEPSDQELQLPEGKEQPLENAVE